MPKPKREKYTDLYHLGDEGIITEWSVVKQGTSYLYVVGKDTEETYEEQQLTHILPKDCRGMPINVNAWQPTNASARSSLGLFFASREDAAEYQRLYREPQAKLAKPKEGKVVKIKHLMEQAYESLREAKRLQESVDE